MTAAVNTVRFESDQLRQLARMIAVETRKHGQPADRIPENLTPKQAVEYSGWGRTNVFAFMRSYPAACTIDSLGQRRVSRRWLDAAAQGEHAIASLRRAAA